MSEERGIRTDLLRQVADRIEGLPVYRVSQPLNERMASMFSMNVLVNGITIGGESPDAAVQCGTATCIAGWLAIMDGQQDCNNGEWVEETAERLGLDKRSVSALCAPFTWWNYHGDGDEWSLHIEFMRLWECREGDEEAKAAAIVCRAVADMAEIVPSSIDGTWILTQWIMALERVRKERAA